MTTALSPGRRIAVLGAAVAFVVAGILLTNTIPPVEGLGDKVRLPIFHGGSTWVNMGLFTLLGLSALAHLVTGKRDLYRWAVGFRYVGAILWIVNTVMGLIAAMQTWDFTGSQQNPLVVAQADPRLMAQVQLLVLVIALLIVDRLIDSDGWKAALDVAFVAGMWWLLGTVLTSPEARALHPDNPVLNSGSEIQIPFFAILACLSVGALLLVWFVRDRMVRAE